MSLLHIQGFSPSPCCVLYRVQGERKSFHSRKKNETKTDTQRPVTAVLLLRILNSFVDRSGKSDPQAGDRPCLSVGQTLPIGRHNLELF